MEVCVSAEGDEFLDAYKHDKNMLYVTGCEERPARVRYEPALGYQTTAQLRGWLSGRLTDEVRKNGLAVRAGPRTMTGVIDAVGELLLLGYPRAQLRQAVRGLRSEELAPVRKLVDGWLKIAPEGLVLGCPDPDAAVKEVQDEVWFFHKLAQVA